MEAVDSDGKAFLIRFADTRSLDALLQVFDEVQRQRFLGTCGGGISGETEA